MYSKGHGGNIYDEAINYDFSVNTNPLGMRKKPAMNSENPFHLKKT